MQGVLFGLYSLIIENARPGGTAIAVSAIVLSVLWFLVMERMRAFVELRYVQGEQLEEKLSGLTTIRIELSLRNDGIAQVYDGEIGLRRHQKLFSISRHLESLLPILTGVGWIVFVLTVR